jgi:hypothetical protein
MRTRSGVRRAAVVATAAPRLEGNAAAHRTITVDGVAMVTLTSDNPTAANVTVATGAATAADG